MKTIRAILFDFDGTLSLNGAIDFAQIRDAIGCPAGAPILEFINDIDDPATRQNAMTILNDHELGAAAVTMPDPAARQVISQLQAEGMRLGIITRNSRDSVLRAFENFKEVSHTDFDMIITRDDPVKPKPSGQGVRLAAERWQINASQILMVGDFDFDISAGKEAGCLTVLLDKYSDPCLADIPCDFRISDLREILKIVRLSRPLAPGKLPNDILEDFLKQFEYADPSILVSAGIGDDTAAVDVSGQEVLVLKSDPITFATDAISQYAVLVNANDIATAGAAPRWFLTTLLLPPKTTALAVRCIMNDLYQTCKKWGIILCGGHTEITDAVTRPVVIGMMAGTIKKADLIEKKNMEPGNKILLTKAVAVEGSAIIAREFSERLLTLGLTQTEIDLGRELLSQISIMPEARLAARSKAATAIHDITEGGLATAVEELSIAGGHRIKINLDAIPFFPLTQKICTLLGIDPLGLIGSGSLLICCKEKACNMLMKKLHDEGIAATCIGEILSPGKGVAAFSNGKEVSWPHFDVDEITRLFKSAT